MGKVKIAVILILLLVSWNTMAQINRYMVFFTDKANTPHTVASPLTFLSQRAIDRRVAQNISVTEEDFPVTPSYVQGLRDAGITVLYKTKWLNGALVECSESEATELTNLSFVSAVEKVAPDGRPPVNGRIVSSNKFKETKTTTSITDTQVSMLAMDKMHAEGFRGEGILIAVIDAGFPGADTISYFNHVFNEGRINTSASFDFVFGVQNVFDHYTKIEQRHGTHVWSTIAAYKNGVYKGGAYKANFVLFVTEDTPSEYRVEEYNWLFAAERADSLGVDVISTSLGYSTFDDPSMDYTYAQDMDGETTVITRASNIAASKGMAIVVSAGNEGAKSWHYITAPADGRKVLAVGAVTASNTKSSISSFGPSADGRFKPDVAALGSSVSIVKADGTLGTASGTSFAAPLTASLVAGYWQKLRNLTAQALLDTIRARGNQFDNPDNLLGYGIPSFYSDVVTEIDPHAPNNFVRVYPTLSKGEVILEFTDGRNSDFTVTLIDTKGIIKTVCSELLEQSKHRIDLSQQSAGMYVLKIYRDRRLSAHKIIKVD